MFFAFLVLQIIVLLGLEQMTCRMKETGRGYPTFRHYDIQTGLHNLKNQTTNLAMKTVAKFIHTSSLVGMTTIAVRNQHMYARNQL